MIFKKWALLGAALLLSTPTWAAMVATPTQYWGGFEDRIGQDYDYNDVIFSLSGVGLTLKSGGAWFEPPVLGTSGNPFWNNGSGDGPNLNVGYCMYVGCEGTAALAPGAQYLAASNGKDSVTDVYFSVGSQVTAQIYLQIAGDSDKLGWASYDPTTHAIGSANWITSGSSFTPGGDFVLLALDNSTGDLFDSYGAQDPNGVSHLAFFAAPEPGMLGLMGGGLVAIGVLVRRRRMNSATK